MVARASTAVGFTPSERPRIAVAADGTLAAIHEPSRISVLEIPSCSSFAELGTDPNASACDVAWVGTPPRLVVLSRYDTYSTVHLVDPFGPRTIAEIRLEQPMRLYAAVGSHALAIGANGSAVLATTDRTLTPFQFPTRTVPITAGAAGAQFMVALPGSIEEWDPQSRMPKRRLKLPRPVTITAVGGSDRAVWMTTTQEPARIEVIPLVNRGQPKAHELPEPIAYVASHPRSDLLACIGASSGRVWVVDLDGRTGLRMVGPTGIDRCEALGLVVGRVAGVIAAQAEHATTVVALGGHEHDGVSSQSAAPTQSGGAAPARSPSTLYGPEDSALDQETPTAVTLATPLDAPPVRARVSSASSGSGPHVDSAGSSAGSSSGSSGSGPHGAASPRGPSPTGGPYAPSSPIAGAHGGSSGGGPATNAPPSRTRAPTGAPPPPAGSMPRSRPVTSPPMSVWSAHDDDAAAQFADWRRRADGPRARTSEPLPPIWPEADPAWRTELLAWAIAPEPERLPKGTPIEHLALRLELPPRLESALALLYVQHLLGKDGLAPVEVSPLFDATWDEALGRGELVSRGLVTFRGSRLRMAEPVLRVLDEHMPRTGTLVGTAGPVSLLGPCVIVSTSPLPIIAEACLTAIAGGSGGAILAGHADADPQELAIEARLYGAAPMWRVRAERLARVPVDQPFILVADDDHIADELGVPRLT